ncbi:MAG: glycosyl hydrolase [Verrucomicrobiota bacterium]
MSIGKLVRLTIIAMLLAGTPALEADDLECGFQNPPESAKPQTWWHWINGNITKEGITADLEAMKKVGLGGADIFAVSTGIIPGPVKMITPEWSALVTHAAKLTAGNAAEVVEAPSAHAAEKAAGQQTLNIEFPAPPKSHPSPFRRIDWR